MKQFGDRRHLSLGWIDVHFGEELVALVMKRDASWHAAEEDVQGVDEEALQLLAFEVHSTVGIVMKVVGVLAGYRATDWRNQLH